MIPSSSSPMLRVAVVSIGRSGTSVISRILHEVLAVDFGDESGHIPRNHNNPDGYFENRELLELNERILAAVGGSVLRPPAIDCFLALNMADKNELVTTARDRLNFYAAEKPRFGWKDPRLSLTFPVWQAAAPSVVAIIAFRDPRAVMRSIADQLEVPAESLAGLWLAYYRRIFSHTAACPRLVVSFDQLLEEPIRVVKTMADFLGMASETEQWERQLAGIVKPKQAKHRAVSGVSENNLALDADAEALYGYLRDTINGGLQPDYAKLERLLNPPSASPEKIISPQPKSWLARLMGR